MPAPRHWRLRGWLAGLLVLLLIGPASAQVSVLSRQPARQAVAVPRDAPVSVSFSQPVSAATAGNLRVFGNLRRGRRAGSVSGGGTSTLNLTPGPAFAPGEVLSVSLPATLTSTGGLAVARQVYQFTAATGGAGRGFFGDTAVVGNTGSRDQQLGDLDNDGDLDLVTTGALYGCRIFLNNGAGKFSFKTGVIAAEEPSGTALADVDQDGDLDLLVSDAENSSVAVCLNDGTGEFIGSVTGAQNAPVGPRPVGIATGDLDGDGDLDFVSVNADGGSATVFRNTTTYAAIGIYYELPTTLSVGSGPSAVALADIDNDGDLDLLTAHTGTFASPLAEVHVSRNNGTGTFGAYTSLAVGARPSALTLADVDGDGDLDLFTANAGAASVSLRLNNGSGSFGGTATLALPAGSTPSGLSTGDLDADGDLDLLVAQGAGGRVITYLNTGGTFAAQARPLRLNRGAGSAAEAVEADGVVLGDVDGDLDLDLITSDGHGQVLLSRNVGSLPPLSAPVITGLTPAAGPVGAMVTINGTAFTDVEEVRFNDLLAPNFILNGQGTGLRVAVPAGAGSGPVTVLTAEAGTATSPTIFTVTIPVPVLVTGIRPSRNAASVPADANVSATFTVPVTAATAGGLRVFGNQRRGRRPGALSGGSTNTLTFDPNQDFAPGEHLSVSWPASLQAADGNQVRGQVAQFTAAVGGSGRHDFLTAGRLRLPTAAAAAGSRLGDLDNDGDLDLAAPGGAAGVLLHLNNGAGSFSPAPVPALTGPEASALLVFGDVDGDADLDIISCPTISTGSTGVVWLNQGGGAFVRGADLPLAGYYRQLLLADFDADGDLDLLVREGSAVRVRANDGSGRFAAAGPAASTGDEYSAGDVSVGDVDGDGDLDVVMPGRSPLGGYFGVAVARNNGAGQLTVAAEPELRGSPSQRMALGDLDGDGDLDLALLSTVNYQYRLLLHLNDGRGGYGPALADLPVRGSALALADLDADGDLDVITPQELVLNDANGFRQVLPSVDPGRETGTLLALGDVDGDLDLDLLTNDQPEEPGTVRIKLNRPGPPPTLAALSPGSGPVGSRVLLRGTQLAGFTRVNKVEFNGVAAPEFVVVSDTLLAATVPAGAESGPLRLTTPAGTAVSAAGFVVTRPLELTALNPAPNAGRVASGSAVAATFAQPVSAATAAELRVFGSRQGGRRTGTVAGGGTRTLTFQPARPFAPGEELSVTLPDRLTGADGSHARRQVYQFRAAAGGTGTSLFQPAGNGRAVAGSFTSYYKPFYSFAVGDFNQDGHPDVFTTEGNLYFTDDEGAVIDSTEFWLSNSPAPRQVALADFDGDGSLDAVSTNGDLLLNPGGRGELTRQPPIAGLGARTRTLAVGDLDADGDLDLLTLDAGRDSLQLRFNDGRGRFGGPVALAAGLRPQGVALGDVDNDGDLDVVVANAGAGTSGAGTISIGLNDGSGLIGSRRSLAAGAGLLSVALGDLDDDLDLDLITNNGLVRLNDGTGTFTGGQTTAAGASLTLADVDADGDLDLLTVAGARAALCRNDGSGQLGAPETIDFGPNAQLLQPQLADVDLDGDLDLLVADSAAHVVHRYLNQRLATPIISSFSPGSDLPGALITITGRDFIGTSGVEFNGTAAPDFRVEMASRLLVRVPAGATSGRLRVLNSRGAATSATDFTVLAPVAVVRVAPASLAMAAANAPVEVQFAQPMPTHTAANLAMFSQQRGGLLAGSRTGAGTATLRFTPARPYAPGEQLSVSVPPYTDANQRRVEKRVYQFTAATGGSGQGQLGEPVTLYYGGGYDSTLGDVDGDGDQDLVNCRQTEVELLRNDGTGTFDRPTPALTLPADLQELTLALGDVDGDGDLDMVVSAYNDKSTATRSSAVLIRLNDGTGNFGGSQRVPVADYPTKLLLADFDGDGDQDVLTGSFSRRAWSTNLCLNDGRGNFSSQPEQVLVADHYGNGGHNTNLLAGDLDGDGDLDLLAATNYFLMLRLNDGNGRFSSQDTQFPRSSYLTGMALGDPDRDGDLDILFLDYSGRTDERLQVALNDGRAAFTLQPEVMLGPDFELDAMDNLVVGDVDADGDPDVVICSYDIAQSQVLLNNGQGRFSLFPAPPRQKHSGRLFSPYLPLLRDLDGDGDLDLLNGGHLEFNLPAPALAITQFSPGTGPEGSTVVLTGTGFLEPASVRFNGVNAPGFKADSPTQLRVKVPAGATTGLITITTPFATAVSATAFTVLPLVVAGGLAPGRHTVGAPRDAAVQLSFGAPITAATASNLRVFGNQRRGLRPGTLSGGGTASLRFQPAQEFAPGEQLSVSVPATLLSTTGGVVRGQVYQFLAATGGSGRGHFGPGPALSLSLGGTAGDLATGDLDNDGRTDLLALSYGDYPTPTSVLVQLGTGGGSFRAGTPISLGTLYGPGSRLTLGDLDADSDLDVVVGSANGAYICLNTGNGTFGLPLYRESAGGYLALGDVDADGDLDLVSTNGRLNVAFNDGRGNFGTAVSGWEVLTPLALLLGDVDNDGDLDVLASGYTNGLQLFSNEGEGDFTSRQTLSGTGTNVSGAALGDIDGDGDLDVVAGCHQLGGTSDWLGLFVNQGDGRFAEAPARVAVGRSATRVVLADLDRDGDLDAVSLGSRNSQLSVRLNDGRGSFSGTQEIAGPSNLAALVVADFDGDLDLDLVAAAEASVPAAVRLLVNGANPLASAPAAAALPAFHIYPNPAHQQFMVQVPGRGRGRAPGADLRLFNALGQLVFSQPLATNAAGEAAVQLPPMPAGLYTALLLLDGQVHSQKLTLR